MSDEATNVKLITEEEIKDSMADPKFYDAMPEFLPLREKMRAMHADLTVKKGCTACAKRRVYNNLASSYITTLSVLKEDGKERIRKYFGASALRATMIHPTTRKPVTVRI